MDEPIACSVNAGDLDERLRQLGDLSANALVSRQPIPDGERLLFVDASRGDRRGGVLLLVPHDDVGAQADRRRRARHDGGVLMSPVAHVTETRKQVVRRLVEEVMNSGDLDALDELYTPSMAQAARRWIAPFLEAFPDAQMEIVDLIADRDTVAARFRCSGTHLGTWRGTAATGRRFTNVDEVYFFRFAGKQISSAWGLEDTLSRLQQLGLAPRP